MRRVQPSTRSFYAMHIDTFHSACKRRERESEYTYTHTPAIQSVYERVAEISREKKQSHKNQRALAEMCVARNIKTTHSLIVRVGLCFFCLPFTQFRIHVAYTII